MFTHREWRVLHDLPPAIHSYIETSRNELNKHCGGMHVTVLTTKNSTVKPIKLNINQNT